MMRLCCGPCSVVDVEGALKISEGRPCLFHLTVRHFALV
jgi:hypothetical protein